MESEAGIIATLIHNPEYYFYSEHLLPNHFTNTENRCVYAAISDLVKHDVYTIDAYNILQDLNSSEATRKFADCINLDSLQELVEMSDVLARGTVEEYNILVQNVLQAAFRRELYDRLKDCETMCMSADIDNLSQAVYTMLDETISDYTAAEDITEFGEITDYLWKEIEEHQSGGCGIPFKIPALNEYVTMEKGELVVVAAPPKGGKSIFMLNTAVDALRRGESVMYIDSELSDRLFLCRLVSHITGIEFNRVKNGKYSPEEYGSIRNTLQWIKEQRFVHMYMPIFDQKSIYVAAKKVFHRFGGLGLLIVDYLKSTGDTDAFATYQELGRLTDLIKNDICGAMNIPGLAAAQLTTNGALADSRKIARNASTIITITDKTVEEIEMDGIECGTKKLFVQFNRNGMQMQQGDYIDLLFVGNKVLFEQAKQHIAEVPY